MSAEQPPWKRIPDDAPWKAAAPAAPQKRERGIGGKNRTKGTVVEGNVTVMVNAVGEMEPEPSEQLKAKLEEFSRQYLIDFNQTRAAMRMGYAEASAANTGNQMFWRPYTQAYLIALIRGMEERAIVGRNQVLAGLLREANNYFDGDSSSRIRAWTEIGKILGMYVVKVEVSGQSSGVMEVPMVRNLEEWEASASPGQLGLMEAART